MKDLIKQQLLDSAAAMTASAELLPPAIAKAAQWITESLVQGGTLLLCGNGGSAADAQHFSAEFLNRYRLDRRPLPAIALTTDTSTLTSIGNDASFDHVFEKQIAALGRKGDVLVAITTSDVSFETHGHSANIALALQTARKSGIRTIGLVSQKSKAVLDLLDLALPVPHSETSRIQEVHGAIIHCICDVVERTLFPEAKR